MRMDLLIVEPKNQFDKKGTKDEGILTM